jgi:hypothetical protein
VGREEEEARNAEPTQLRRLQLDTLEVFSIVDGVGQGDWPAVVRKEPDMLQTQPRIAT